MRAIFLRLFVMCDAYGTVAAVAPLQHWLLLHPSTFRYSGHARQNHQVVKTRMRDECNDSRDVVILTNLSPCFKRRKDARDSSLKRKRVRISMSFYQGTKICNKKLNTIYCKTFITSRKQIFSQTRAVKNLIRKKLYSVLHFNRKIDNFLYFYR